MAGKGKARNKNEVRKRPEKSINKCVNNLHTKPETQVHVKTIKNANISNIINPTIISKNNSKKKWLKIFIILLSVSLIIFSIFNIVYFKQYTNPEKMFDYTITIGFGLLFALMGNL